MSRQSRLIDFGLIGGAHSGKAMEDLVADGDERHRNPGYMVLTERPTDVVAVPRAYRVDQMVVPFGPGVLVELGPFSSDQYLKISIAAVEKVVLFEMISTKFEVPFNGRDRHFPH